jgi:hypothetical protein
MYIQIITLVLLRNLTSIKDIENSAKIDTPSHTSCLLKNELATSPKLFIVTKPRITIIIAADNAGRSM